MVGREADLGVIEAMLTASGRAPRMLLLEGEAGIGKSTLWRAAIARAAELGHPVLRARPSPSERGLAFSALADLLDGVPDARIDELPGPQADALRAALLRGPAADMQSDPRALGRGLATILSVLSARRPLLLAVDDTQWVDHASARALVYALRRLEERAVHAVLTRRSGEPEEVDLAAELGPALSRHRVGPLDPGAITDIVRAGVGTAPSRPQLERIIRVSRGNPFHALEVARALEGADAEGMLAVPDDLRRLTRGRMRRLPRGTRAALLRAAALAHPTTLLVDAAALAPAEEADIVTVGDDGVITFTHPLFAEAVYAAAPRARRRLLHAELAAHAGDPEQRAHHLACAGDGPDERIAAALDEAADRAERRGAPGVAAGHAAHAAKRTPPADASGVRRRLLRAAALRLRAGDADAARAHAERVVASEPSGPVRAEALFLTAQALAFMGPRAPVASLQEALLHTGRADDLAARIHLGLALADMATGDPAAALAHLDRAVALGGADGTRAEAAAFRQAASLFAGRGVEHGELERALALEPAEQPAAHLLRPTLMVASVEVFTGRLTAARERLAAHIAWATPRGEDATLAFAGAYLATASLLQGELGRAWEEARGTVLAGEGAAFAMRYWSAAVQGMADVLRGTATPASRSPTRRSRGRSPSGGPTASGSPGGCSASWRCSTVTPPPPSRSWTR
ncbi:MAG: AAA family ATPase [Thermoleophilia bacterium]